jgi:hypothetical protein
MRKLTILLFAGLLVVGMTLPALADVVVRGDIDKFACIDVIQLVLIDKDITIAPVVKFTVPQAAQADSVVNQANTQDFACENCAEKYAYIYNSLNSNSGIINTNQAVGSFNNQGNVVSIAIDTNGPGGVTPPSTGVTGSGFANAETAAQQINELDMIRSINILLRNATIDTSINSNQGIVGLNQSAGNINNQLNAITMAVALSGNGALSEADLGQSNVGIPFGLIFGSIDTDTNVNQSIVYEYNTNKNALITNAVNSNTGIVGVNQTVGNMANQANIANLSAYTSSAPTTASLPTFK